MNSSKKIKMPPLGITDTWYVEICNSCKFRNAGYYVGTDSPYKKVPDIKLRKCLKCGQDTHLEYDDITPEELTNHHETK